MEHLDKDLSGHAVQIVCDDGQLTWEPKVVLFEGKEYPAPFNILPILTYRTILESLVELKKKRTCNNKSSCGCDQF